MKNGHDNDQRPLPPPFDEKLLDNQWRNGKTRQETSSRPPLRAIKIKGDELRSAVRGGKPLDWSDINSCFADLWQKARLVVWRAKHSKSGIKVADPKNGKESVDLHRRRQAGAPGHRHLPRRPRFDD